FASRPRPGTAQANPRPSRSTTRRIGWRSSSMNWGTAPDDLGDGALATRGPLAPRPPGVPRPLAADFPRGVVTHASPDSAVEPKPPLPRRPARSTACPAWRQWALGNIEDARIDIEDDVPPHRERPRPSPFVQPTAGARFRAHLRTADGCAGRPTSRTSPI